MVSQYLLIFLTISAFTAYVPSTSAELAQMSSIAYQNTNSINSWNCDICSIYKIANPKAFSIQIGDLQGFTGYSNTLKSIIVTFRGSSNIQNWIINLSTLMVPYYQCTNCYVHLGFYKGWNLTKDLVYFQISQLRKLYANAPIYVTGHSLGGALATLAVAHIVRDFGNVGGLYTFGQPRVGNRFLATFINSKVQYFRVIYYGDIVPHVPIEMFLYVHAGTQIWYDKGLKTYKSCQGDTVNCSNSMQLIFLNIFDHSMNFYINLPKGDPLRSLGGIQIIDQPAVQKLSAYLTKG